MAEELLSVAEAAKFLRVSRPTFNKIRQDRSLPEIKIGKRAKFRKSDLLQILGQEAPQNTPAASPTAKATIPKGRFDLFSNKTIANLEIAARTFDLRGIEFLDPYGVLSLLATVIDRGRDGAKVKLLVESGISCKYLHSINFFDEAGRFCKNLEWNHEALATVNYINPETLLPIIPIRLKGSERTIAEKLNTMLKQQGFSPEVGQYISWILGELADNSLTHSSQLPLDRICYVLATRFTYGESNCVVVGIADLGIGIQNSLRSLEKYKTLSDERALLEAFKPFVSSWAEEYKRGKGLTDVVKIAMGNNSHFIVASNQSAFLMDFRENSSPRVERRPPMADVAGTRYGLVLIDNNFKPIPRSEVGRFLTKEIKRLGL